MSISSEQRQAIHRTLNTIMSITLFVMLLLMINPVIKSTQALYEQVNGVAALRILQSELAQIVEDEGYRAKPYRDTLGLWTVGFGHLIKPGEKFSNLSPHNAVLMLRKDYDAAQAHVERQYSWATNSVKLVLINMTYQMGGTRLSKFKKTTGYLKAKEYDLAAGEMLDSLWARQTPLRASRLAGRIMQLKAR